MNEPEQRAILSICIMAAFIDGVQTEAERMQIQQIAENFHGQSPDLALAYQEVLDRKPALKEIAGRLENPDAKTLAYEMAVCVCHADGALSEAEKQFLATLQAELGLDAQSTAAVQAQAHQLATATLEPASVPPRLSEVQGVDAALDGIILNYSILTGALELLPHSLATMAIIPLQMRMVYRVGQRYGFDLGRGHIKDFLGTVGIGLTSQVVEGFARRLIGSLSRQIGGGLVGGLVSQAAGSAVSFGTTYALGQAAKRYYAGGRTLDAAQLKQVFASLLNEGKALQGRYQGEILQKSRQINLTQLLPLVRQAP